jgi:hypothetical protein
VRGARCGAQVRGAGCGVQGAGCRVRGAGCGVQGAGRRCGVRLYLLHVIRFHSATLGCAATAAASAVSRGNPASTWLASGV